MEIEKGFYYHYKHDPEGSMNNYAYEVMGVGHHTEIVGLESSTMVLYRPLYESAPVYILGKHWDVRPYAMFIEDVIKEGKTIARFTKITDSETIDFLEKVKNKMYP